MGHKDVDLALDGGDGEGRQPGGDKLIVELYERAGFKSGPLLDAGGGGGAGFGVDFEGLRGDGAVGAFGDVEGGGELGVGLV